VTKGRNHKALDNGARRVVSYIDAEGRRTSDPGSATRGEILEYNGEDHPKRTWFFLKELEINWLPMSEGAFLLWVLVFLFGVWALSGVLFGLF
jgi:hypothetical protein